MRKYLFFILVSLASCSDEKSSSETIQQNEANFALSKNSERTVWNNIQVGERVKFDVKIKNFDSSTDVVYVLKPITADATKHQQNKIDYNFQEEVKIPSTNASVKDSVLTKKTQDSIILKKANSSFFVSILKAGNFVQQYELRKMQSNKYVAGSTQEMLFSAVKIDVYTRNVQTDNSTMFSSSKHSRYYEFTIDDGDQTNDVYLTDSDSKQNTYTALYNGKKYDGNIVINNVMTFSEKVNTEKGAQIVPDWILAELKITQKRNHEPDNIISYYNLNIKQK
ncbi:hypothetical protein [Flavobacterium pectinovorum]|uniref:Uncharacterized protein n=1 Tax=Flavobacterium pectinovorum TaxID=29533 RepID=A0A502E8G4_9FLAO|nr:hypothetical protein [Flavobacterium pectinovorum]TPG34028.1 hypothetical protein EAH81_22765 [Flavobacterium pectinovorum]